MRKVVFLVLFSLFLILALASAEEYALDVQTNKPIYSAGENLSYKVILLKNNIAFSDNVKVFFSDIQNKKTLDFDVKTNEDNFILIDKDFSSGYWKIETAYSDKTVKRFFTIGEREEADFSIEGDTLIIKNSGNVPYTRTVQILIGEKVISQKQYIEIGDYKEIKLVAPDGNYNVQVSDGVNSIVKQDVYITGTGRVIGALDQELVDNQPILGGARDSNSESFFSTKNFSVAFIFIGAVFGLFVLLAVEKLMHKNRAERAKDMVRLH